MPKYSVYRSNSSGNPPFERITDGFITDTTFTDHIPSLDLSLTYRYYITADYFYQGSFLSESGPSDTVTAVILSSGSQAIPAVTLAPNPSEGLFRVSIPAGTTSLEVDDLRGKQIMQMDVARMTGSSADVNLAQQPKGIYMLTLTGEWGRKTAKLVLE
jgi:hypothetical protein